MEGHTAAAREVRVSPRQNSTASEGCTGELRRLARERADGGYLYAGGPPIRTRRLHPPDRVAGAACLLADRAVPSGRPYHVGCVRRAPRRGPAFLRRGDRGIGGRYMIGRQCNDYARYDTDDVLGLATAASRRTECRLLFPQPPPLALCTGIFCFIYSAAAAAAGNTILSARARWRGLAANIAPSQT